MMAVKYDKILGALREKDSTPLSYSVELGEMTAIIDGISYSWSVTIATRTFAYEDDNVFLLEDDDTLVMETI